MLAVVNTEHTHHCPSVVRVWPDSRDNIFADALEDFGTTENKWIGFIGEFGSGFRAAERIFCRDLLQCIRFTGCGRFVAFDVVSFGKNTVDWDEITRFEMKDVANNNIINVDKLGVSASDYFDISVFFLS